MDLKKIFRQSKSKLPETWIEERTVKGKTYWRARYKTTVCGIIEIYWNIPRMNQDGDSLNYYESREDAEKAIDKFLEDYKNNRLKPPVVKHPYPVNLTPPREE